MLRTFLVLMGVLAWATDSHGRVLMSINEAVRQAFPAPAEVEKVRVFLSKEEAETVRKKWSVPLESRLFTFFRGTDTRGQIGHAGVDTHTLRTKPETILVVIGGNGKLRMVEVLNFYEPFDYFPPARWLKFFDDPSDWRDLIIGRELPNVTGATITAHRLAEAVRRIMAVYEFAVHGKSQ